MTAQYSQRNCIEQVVVVIPEVPGFAGSIHDEAAIKTIMAAQYRTMNRGGHSIYEGIRNAGFEPYVSFHCSQYRLWLKFMTGRITSASTIYELMIELMRPTVRTQGFSLISTC